MDNDICYLYWIRKPEHTDIFTQGYVGITTDIVRRWNQHVYSAKNGKHVINKAIKKYGDSLLYETILIGTKDYCLDMEFKLRPEDYIGWNSNKGGKPIGRIGSKNDNETREKLSAAVKAAYANDPTYRIRASLARKGKKHTEEHKAKIKESMQKLNYKPWTNSRARVDIWELALEFHEYYQATECSRGHLSEYFSVNYDTIRTIFNWIKDGWNPMEDSDWLAFYNKGK